MLQITLVMEDKISLDDLQEEIAEFEDYVQSTDVAGMCSPSIHPVLKLTLSSYAKALEERSRFLLYGIRRRMHFCYNATSGISELPKPLYRSSFQSHSLSSLHHCGVEGLWSTQKHSSRRHWFCCVVALYLLITIVKFPIPYPSLRPHNNTFLQQSNYSSSKPPPQSSTACTSIMSKYSTSMSKYMPLPQANTAWFKYPTNDDKWKAWSFAGRVTVGIVPASQFVLGNHHSRMSSRAPTSTGTQTQKNRSVNPITAEFSKTDGRQLATELADNPGQFLTNKHDIGWDPSVNEALTSYHRLCQDGATIEQLVREIERLQSEYGKNNVSFVSLSPSQASDFLEKGIVVDMTDQTRHLLAFNECDASLQKTRGRPLCSS